MGIGIARTWLSKNTLGVEGEFHERLRDGASDKGAALVTEEEIFEQTRLGMVLVIEPESAFLDEGARHIGCDRARVTVDYATAIRVSTSGKMRLMTDAEVSRCVQVSPRGRFFFEFVQ